MTDELEITNLNKLTTKYNKAYDEALRKHNIKRTKKSLLELINAEARKDPDVLKLRIIYNEAWNAGVRYYIDNKKLIDQYMKLYEPKKITVDTIIKKGYLINEVIKTGFSEYQEYKRILDLIVIPNKNLTEKINEVVKKIQEKNVDEKVTDEDFTRYKYLKYKQKYLELKKYNI